MTEGDWASVAGVSYHRTVRLPVAVDQAVRAVAGARGCSMSEVIREAVTSYVGEQQVAAHRPKVPTLEETLARLDQVPIPVPH